MNIRTSEDILQQVIRNWFIQYPNDRDGIGERLKSEKPKTKKEIASIIGNNSWTRMECYECQEDVDLLIQFEQTTPEGDFVEVCENCVKIAIDSIPKRTIIIS